MIDPVNKFGIYSGDIPFQPDPEKSVYNKRIILRMEILQFRARCAAGADDRDRKTLDDMKLLFQLVTEFFLRSGKKNRAAVSFLAENAGHSDSVSAIVSRSADDEDPIHVILPFFNF